MKTWSRSFVGVEANLELLFERYEILGSLASFGENVEADLEQAATSAAGNNTLAWMPMGRVGWHGASSKVLFRELQSEAFAVELLSAGFANKSRRFLELFIENLRRFMQKMSW
jgi:hypothetical protein